MSDPQLDALRQQLIQTLRHSESHAGFDKATADFPRHLQGAKHVNAPHTPWQLLEHIRITQWDILEFIRNPNHQSPKFPEGYWPKMDVPPDDNAWNRVVESFHRDSEALQQMVADPARDLFAKIPHGQGQTFLREVMLVIDHNAYEIGQLILLRRQMGAWKE